MIEVIQTSTFLLLIELIQAFQNALSTLWSQFDAVREEKQKLESPHKKDNL